MSYSKLIKNKNFIALWIGQVISEFGDRLAQMALIASVYYGIDNGHIFRLTTLLSFTIIPVFFIGPVAGAYIDRWDRKRTLITSDILRGLFVLLIPLSLSLTKSFIPIYAVVFIMFSVTRFFLPAKLGIIPDITDKDTLLSANSLITTTGLIAAITGLGFGSILVEVVGIKCAFYIDSLTFCISALAIFLIHPKNRLKSTPDKFSSHSIRIKEIEKNIFMDIFDSIKYIFRQKGIPSILKTFFILMSGIGAIYVIFIDFILKNIVAPPKVVQEIQKTIGFSQFGLIIFFIGLGAFSGILFLGRFDQKLIKQKAISSGFLFTGIFLVLFSYATQIFKNFWITSVLSIMLGFAIAPIIAIANTMLHEATKNEMRGRVFSSLEIVIHIAFLSFMFISMFLVSTLKVPPVHILGAAGILAFLYGALKWKNQRS